MRGAAWEPTFETERFDRRFRDGLLIAMSPFCRIPVPPLVDGLRDVVQVLIAELTVVVGGVVHARSDALTGRRQASRRLSG